MTPQHHRSVLNNLSLDDIEKVLPRLNESDKARLLEELEVLLQMRTKEAAREDFMSYVRQVYPGYIAGRHHKIMADAFQRVANGTCKRLIINMPPRHMKSIMGSYLFPSWFLGKFPRKKIIQCSVTAELAVGFGRQVRNLVDSEIYQNIFPDVSLRTDSKAAGRWNTNQNGQYYAIGVGGSVTGQGGDIIIIDDPHDEQMAVQAETNPEIYDKVYEWFTSGPRQRLQPNGALVLIMCMTGDTLVLMGDGSEKQLRNIRPGDNVVTYENDGFTTSVINNWQSSGVDSIYKVQTQSGIILRANERHPFLVDDKGELRWKRLKELKPGDILVSLKDVQDLPEQKLNQENADLVKQVLPTTGKTHTPLIKKLGFTVNGRVRHVVKKVAQTLYLLKDYVRRITTRKLGLKENIDTIQRPDGNVELSIVTGSQLNNTTQCLSSKEDVAPYASSHQGIMLEHTGEVNYVSTIATTPEKSEHYCVTTATSQLGTEKTQKLYSERLDIYQVSREVIQSISYDGEEEVFDVEVDRTENFIANGVVSHNTRWSKRDLTAQIIKAAAQRDGENWEVIELPALFDGDKPLWPEFWSKDALVALRNELPNAKWQAQYQQQPTSDVSAIVKREWWKIWEETEPPRIEFCLQSWDTAFLKTQRSDYSACTTWGVFYKDDDTGRAQANIILLNAFKERMEFPELKQRAIREYKEWSPDSIIIEAKAAGSPLIFELRRMGIPVQDYTPSKGSDKIARLNSVADIFSSGRVWAPRKHWAEEVIEEVASFPSSEHDDITDTVSQAMLRFRQGGFIQLHSDQEDEIPEFRRKREYY